MQFLCKQNAKKKKAQTKAKNIKRKKREKEEKKVNQMDANENVAQMKKVRRWHARSVFHLNASSAFRLFFFQICFRLSKKALVIRLFVCVVRVFGLFVCMSLSL